MEAVIGQRRRTAFFSTTRRTTTQTPMPTRSMYCGSSERDVGSLSGKWSPDRELRRVRAVGGTKVSGMTRFKADGSKDEPRANRDDRRSCGVGEFSTAEDVEVDRVCEVWTSVVARGFVCSKWRAASASSSLVILDSTVSLFLFQ